jgi:DNA invertase Pin-like site-specific DNA recombinase
MVVEAPFRAVGYIRVSTDEQADSGLGLDAQRAAIEGEIKRRGWNLVHVFTDTASGRSLSRRPGLEEALTLLESDGAAALIVSKLDRLSRSTKDFATLMERAQRRGWAPVVLDLGVDTTTPAGEMVASVMMSVAQWERKIIGQRTKEALAAKRGQAVTLGRPRQLSDNTRRKIVAMRTRGMTYRAIAEALDGKGVPTAQGGARWYPSTVRKVVQTEGHDGGGGRYRP